jgi:hypothetical protein
MAAREGGGEPNLSGVGGSLLCGRGVDWWLLAEGAASCRCAIRAPGARTTPVRGRWFASGAWCVWIVVRS